MNLQELKAAYEAATPGKWFTDTDGRIFRDKRSNCEIAQCFLAGGTNLDQSWVRNAHFIALAHNMMPQLLEAVERLDRLAGAFETVMTYYGPDMPEHDCTKREQLLQEAFTLLDNLKGPSDV